MKETQEYSGPSGQLKKYDSWYVLDDKMLCQYLVKGDDSGFKNGMKVKYSICIDSEIQGDSQLVSEVSRYAKITEIIEIL